MRSCIILIGLIFALFMAPASAVYTNIVPSTDTIIINQSSVQDPTNGNAVPWTLWILSGGIGLILVVIALLKPRLNSLDYESTIIISVMSWPFLWYWTWGSLRSIDRIIGIGMTNTGTGSVMITQHILYSFPVLGYIGVGIDVAAFIITAVLVGQFKLFKENEEKQRSGTNEQNES